ncbi:MAG: ABC transporter, permease protein 1 (cluster 5, nickel/peptides/opines) [uncultured Caballeronia sp.]|nr:MAG: ABC transporter, permease protein 1 (cluster 5, nickel/peptides/opines) [uncultured Caballeronia sp.]
MLIAVIGQAMPSFWFSLTLILVFSVGLKWLPVAGNASWQNFVLPAIALGYYATPAMMRLTRAGMLDVLGADYIRTARAKGLSPARVVFKHALRNALIVVLTLEMAHAILLEATLSFLGLSVPPPMPFWGLMISEGKTYMFFQPWVIVIPGVALAVLVLAINLVGDGLRDLNAPDGRN